MTPSPPRHSLFRFRPLQHAVLTALACASQNAVSAFAPRRFAPRPSRRSPRAETHPLRGFFDAVGDLLSGPKLETEAKLPYDPPLSSELSIADRARTFAIKERP